MKNLFALFSILCMMALFACQDENPDRKLITTAEKNYTTNPSKETGSKYIASITIYNEKYPENQDKEKYFQKAINIAKEQDLVQAEASLLSSYIKEYPDGAQIKQYILDLSNILEKSGKIEARNILRTFFAYRYPDDNITKEILSELSDPIINPDSILYQKAKAIFENVDKVGINSNAAIAYVDACEAFAITNPKDPRAPSYLYKAAEMAKTTLNNNKSLAIFNWIYTKYPESKEAPKSLFLLAFMYDDTFNNIEKARELYQKFIDKYPTHDLADDAKFSIENLGKSDEEIQKYLERVSSNPK